MGTVILNIVWGDTLSLVAICFGIVLAILLLFVGILKIFEIVSKKEKNKDAVTKPIVSTDKNKPEISEAEYAAIAMAIHMYYDVKHDEESMILTIKNNPQSYSPWNIIK